MTWLVLLFALGELQNVIVNGTFGTSPAEHRMTIVKDMTQLPPEAIGQQELAEVSCDRKSLEAFVVRQGGAPDSVARFGEANVFLQLDLPKPVEPPCFKDEARLLLLYYTGLAEKTDGTQFVVRANKTILAVEAATDPTWKLCCVDLTPWAGQRISLSFTVTNPPAWAAFGHPVLVDLWGPCQSYPGGLAGTTGGASLFSYEKTDGNRVFPKTTLFGLARVDAFSPASLAVSLSTQSWTEWNESQPAPVSISTGTHWLPLIYECPTLFGYHVLSGQAHVRQLDLVPLPPDFPRPK